MSEKIYLLFVCTILDLLLLLVVFLFFRSERRPVPANVSDLYASAGVRKLKECHLETLRLFASVI